MIIAIVWIFDLAWLWTQYEVIFACLMFVHNTVYIEVVGSHFCFTFWRPKAVILRIRCVAFVWGPVGWLPCCFSTVIAAQSQSRRRTGLGCLSIALEWNLINNSHIGKKLANRCYFTRTYLLFHRQVRRALLATPSVVYMDVTDQANVSVRQYCGNSFYLKLFVCWP